MVYETVDVSAQRSTLVSTTWYDYNVVGNPTRIITKPEASSQYSAARFEYAKNGETVTFIVGEVWEADGSDPDMCPESYDITFAREFRYDSGRARYLNRELDPAGLMQNPPQFVPLTETWTDYDGDESYGDYTVSGGSAANAGSYELGVASVAPWAGAGNASTSYWHNDLIGTLRNETGPDGSGSGPRVYTAFGEPVAGSTTRYGFVGSWGYQGHDDFPFLHVGTRYYHAATGRFLNRDHIGILGDSNTYSYVNHISTIAVDPEGLQGSARPRVPFRYGHQPRLPVTPPGYLPPYQSPDSPGFDFTGRPQPTGRFTYDFWNGLCGVLPGPVLPPPRPRPQPFGDPVWWATCPFCGNPYNGSAHLHNGNPRRGND
jgi:RHS repeat-associated protein